MKAKPSSNTHKIFAIKIKALFTTAINLLVMPIGAYGIYTLINFYDKHKHNLNSTIWAILFIIGFVVLLFAFTNKPKSGQLR
ncbi:hypothetical protein GCM10027037_04100 [Mucilaginibacter koreensis]